MKEVFVIKSCSYQEGNKVTQYLVSDIGEPTWTLNIAEANTWEQYPLAVNVIGTVITPGAFLQVEKYFVA